MAEFISEDKQKFLESSIDDDFDISIDTVANKVKNYSRFKSLLGSNVSNIKKVLNIVKDAGMSPTFFGAYEINEGYTSQFGWLNRTYYTGDPYNDAKSVAQTMVNISNDTSTFPSWTDTGTNNLDFVPQDVKEKGNKHFNNLPKGTIGRAYIPSTAAATWDAYYPNGLKAEYNGIQDYGGAITDALETIKSWGGTIGGNKHNDNSDGNDDNGTDLENLFQDLTEEGLKVAKQMLKKIEDAFQWDIHSIGTDNYFSNEYFQIMKTYNNTYKIKWRPDFLKMFGNLYDEITGDNNSDASEDDDSGHSGNNKKFNTCYLYPERGYMQGYYPTAEIARQNGYPANAAHKGLDFRMTSETLKSIGDGTVYHSYQVDASGWGWGNYVVLYPDGDYNYCFLFAHLEEISISNGQKVKKGDKLGVTGMTGSPNPNSPDNRHLHFEMIKGNNKNEGANPSGQRVNPTNFILKYCNKVNKDNFKKDDTIYYG